MVDIEERILDRIDRICERLADHCKRITTIEQDHIWKEKKQS